MKSGEPRPFSIQFFSRTSLPSLSNSSWRFKRLNNNNSVNSFPAFLHVRKLPTRPAHDKYLARKPNFHIPERRVWVNEGRPKGVPQSGKAKITYSTEVGFTAEYSYESAEPGWLEESNSVAQVFHCPFTCSRQGQVFLFR